MSRGFEPLTPACHAGALLMSYGPNPKNVSHIDQPKDYSPNVLNFYSTLKLLIIEISKILFT